MSLAIAALRELDALSHALRRKLSLPAISECERYADVQARPSAEGVQLPAHVLETLRQDLLAACAGPGASTLPKRQLRRAPLVFWHGEPQAAGFPGLRDAFLLAAVTRARWLRTLIEAWFRDFGPDRVALAETGNAITALLHRPEHAPLQQWLIAHQSYALFDRSDGPRRLARALLHGPEEVGQVLTRSRMNDPLRENGGYFRAAMSELISLLPDALRAPTATAAWRRAAGLLEVTRVTRDRLGRELRSPALRFDDMAGAVARSSLRPWLDGTARASAPRDEVKGFLLRMIGDPRLSPARWSGAGEDATRLMRSWLASASLEVFLDLISQTNDDQQWRYRQAFWRACLRKAPTAEVWVVLGSDLVNRAASVHVLHGAFGRLERGADSQAVLLMQISNLVLSEWSNVGRVRAWDAVVRLTPKLYHKAYSVQALRAPSLDFPDHPIRGNGGSMGGKGLVHHSGATGLWQGCAAALLANRLGLHLPETDYMPQ